MARKLLFVCRKCGERMEASTTVDLTVADDGSLVLQDVSLDPVHWYCKNDHDAPEQHAQALSEHYASLTAFGRPPGSGGLNIKIFPIPERTTEG